MKKSEDTNLASEFYVASQLYRLGYVTVLTLGHTKEIDLVAIHPDGRTVTIDVKGLKNTNLRWTPLSRHKIAVHLQAQI